MELNNIQKVILLGCVAQYLEREGLNPDAYFSDQEKEKMLKIVHSMHEMNDKEINFHVCDLYARLIAEVLG